MEEGKKNSNLQEQLFILGLLQNKEIDKAYVAMQKWIVKDMSSMIMEYANASHEIGADVEEVLQNALARVGARVSEK